MPIDLSLRPAPTTAGRSTTRLTAARSTGVGTAIAALALLTAALVGATPSNRASAAPRRPHVWRTIKIGTIGGVIALREALDSPGCGTAVVAVAETAARPFCHLADDANQALGQHAFSLSPSVATIGLTEASAADLGFPAAAMPSIAQIYARAEQSGLAVCPAEVGPQLQLQYLDQPLGEFLAIAMQPVSNYAGEPLLFLVGNGGAGLLLASRKGALDTTVPTFVMFVFCIPQGPPARGQ